ncbi:DUF3515 family protein [Granulicoccus phenolivorans]|uniref:DUF3515 family protein n=1 Tax=Granulicoccus phenolivorans TaxID=266854 RepID=UPI000410322D|nr:DUF3515 family protein [Granulicoccus phenolivorans]
MPPLTRRAVPGALAALVLLSACTPAAVDVTAPSPDSATAAICGPLLAEVPRTVTDLPQRTTTSEWTRAWGDPPVALACGVAKPAAMQQDSQCFEVNGVGWFAEPATGGYVFTTLGRAAYVQVNVPAQYSPEANVLTEFSAAINAHDPVQQPCV